jgi:hypothetical protein
MLFWISPEKKVTFIYTTTLIADPGGGIAMQTIPQFGVRRVFPKRIPQFLHQAATTTPSKKATRKHE